MCFPRNNTPAPPPPLPPAPTPPAPPAMPEPLPKAVTKPVNPAVRQAKSKLGTKKGKKGSTGDLRIKKDQAASGLSGSLNTGNTNTGLQ